MWLKMIAAFKPRWSGPHSVVLWLLYVLIVLGSLYRINYILDHNPVDYIGTDMERHWTHGAEDPLNDDPFIMGDPILYQLYIGALAKLSLKLPPLIAFYTILLSLLMPWIWYRFFRELQPSKLIALGGWAVITWLPSWNSIYGYFMTETLFLPVLGAALWASWRCKRKQTVSTFVLMTLLWTLTGLTRGIGIPLAAVTTVWLWLEQGSKLKKAAYGMLLLGLILGPLTYRGFERVHIFAPSGLGMLTKVYGISGKQEINLEFHREGAVWYFGFWSPSMGSEPFEPLSHWKSQREGVVKVYIDVDKGYEDWNIALRENAMTLDRALWIVKENLIFLFFGESWPDSDRSEFLGEINYQMRWIWVPLSLAVLAWTLVCRRSQRRHLMLPAIILTWFIMQGLMVITVNEGRYRKPFEGLLVAQMVFLAGTCRRRPELEASQPEDRRHGQADRRQVHRRQADDRRQGSTSG
jgi:hypothetical protein